MALLALGAKWAGIILPTYALSGGLGYADGPH